MPEELYFIWSNEHQSWWCANSMGYCANINNAGRYTKDEAIKICNGANYSWDTENNPNELPIAETAAMMLSPRKPWEPR